MRKLKILGLSASFLLLMFLGSTQMRPLPANADSYGVDSHMRAYRSFDNSNLTNNDISLISRGFDHYDQRHTQYMKKYVDDAVKKAIQEHERNKHR